MLEQMMESLLLGEEKGFTFFYKLHFIPMTVFARRWLRAGGMAEDIVQDCFIAWWNHRTETVNPQAIKAYLYTIVRNACLNHNRNSDCRISHERQREYLLGESPADIARHIIYAETLREIYALVKLLPPKCQEVFRLIYLKDMTYGEVAAELHITESTIRTQKARALLALRQLTNTLFVFLLAAIK